MRNSCLIAAAVLWLTAGAADACNGCSCKCGPGFRLPGGRCASWNEHWGYKAIGGYPAGTVDELATSDENATCPKAKIEIKRNGGN